MVECMRCAGIGSLRKGYCTSPSLQAAPFVCQVFGEHVITNWVRLEDYRPAHTFDQT